jgi:hypothetical protein
MIKRISIIVAMFLLTVFVATSAFALVDTENGPVNITNCWATGTGPMTSGNVVVLQTSSPTYWGREVTGSTTSGQQIYGVVVDTEDYTGAEMASGKWIRVQTSGYCPIIRVNTGANGGVDVAVTDGLYCSGTAMRAASSGGVTGNVVALSTISAGSGNGTCRGFINGL